MRCSMDSPLKDKVESSNLSTPIKREYITRYESIEIWTFFVQKSVVSPI